LAVAHSPQNIESSCVSANAHLFYIWRSIPKTFTWRNIDVRYFVCSINQIRVDFLIFEGWKKMIQVRYEQKTRIIVINVDWCLRLILLCFWPRSMVVLGRSRLTWRTTRTARCSLFVRPRPSFSRLSMEEEGPKTNCSAAEHRCSRDRCQRALREPKCGYLRNWPDTKFLFDLLSNKISSHATLLLSNANWLRTLTVQHNIPHYNRL